MKYPKTYFILPTTVYKPDDLIQLGQVITDPRKPFERLAKPLPLKGPLKPRTLPDREWSAMNANTRENSVGLFATVFNSMTASASSSQGRQETQTWEAALLETRYFEISEDSSEPTYIEQTVMVPAVEKWLREHRRWGKMVYMVTGLKIARNPTKVTYDGADSSSFAGSLKATLDPEGAVEAGGEAARLRSAAATLKARPGEAYVFAYRLRRLRVSWRNKLKQGDYKTGGDLYDIGRGRTDVKEKEDEEDDLALEMDGVEVEQDDFGESLPRSDKKSQAVDEDDDSPCLVVHISVKNLS